ncbi:MAG: hypothetical protein LBC74_01635 [Planctomycetaceae bacterium]|nr:hypothetical protein [Planctomycetaceae bacterium]
MSLQETHIFDFNRLFFSVRLRIHILVKELFVDIDKRTISHTTTFNGYSIFCKFGIEAVKKDYPYPT